MLRYIQRDARPFDAAVREALRPYGGITARLLFSRGITSAAQAQAFLNPSLEALYDPMLMSDMGKALELIGEAKENVLPTVVYGDYDVDGICATALLTLALRRFGIAARTRTPLRAEGYGLNRDAVSALAAEGCKLLITVDLGITNHDEVLLAQSLGMRVIVTDHHGLPLTPCPADAALNPLLGDYPFGRLCGTGVAFKLAQALIGLPACEEYLDLAALATVADIVPLLDENRALVALGLPHIKSGRRAGIKALMDVSGVVDTVDSDTLGYRLGPRLNAAGRLGDAADGVRLLLTDDAAEARAIAERLDELNTRRKSEENALIAEARLQARENDFISRPLIIARGKDWNEGVIGLAAGRLCQRYCCPVCVMSERDGLLRGSLRSVPGVHIYKCLQACDDLLLRYGGHELAAGVTLEADKLDEFDRRMQAEVLKAAPESFMPSQVYDAEAEPEALTEALLDEMELLAPFGCDNPAPLLLTTGLSVEEARAVGADGAHLKLTLRKGGRVMGGIAFSMGRMASSMPPSADAVYSLGRNTFRGVTSLQMDVKAIKPSSDFCGAACVSDARGALVDALADMTADMGEAGNTAPRAEYNAVSATWDELREALGARRRGLLLAARTPEAFARAAALAELDICERAASDPRGFNTLVAYPSIGLVSGCWREVWLLDGELWRGEARMWRERLPMAEVYALDSGAALAELAAGMDAGDDSYRELYRAIRKAVPRTLRQAADAAGIDETQARVGLRAFDELKLVRYDESPFLCVPLAPVKCSLGDSPTLGAIRRLAADDRPPATHHKEVTA